MQGAQGLSGNQGLQGVIGAQGLQGLSGNQGLQGVIGAQGLQGLSGNQGLQGLTGPSTLINATDDIATTLLYPVMVGADGSNQTPKVTTSKLYFDAATGTLNATEYNSLSDVTYKEDLKIIDNASEILDSIKTYQFKWKETGVKSYGVIAQELEDLLPELINNSNGNKYVNYTPLIAILLEGFKDLSTRIKSLEKE